MVSMKLTKADREAEKKKYDGPCSIDSEEYPYGLRLNLDNRALKKLGIKGLPDVGSTMTITAKVDVVGARQEDRADGRSERNLDLQITDLALDTDGGAVAAVDKAIRG